MYDFIVVGGGSAGCVVAARLSENPNFSVLLLEAGPSHRDPRFEEKIRNPGFFNQLWQLPTAWPYFTEPEEHLNRRRVFWPRGRVLGGSGSINSVVYIRGNRRDFDYWAYLGNDGWSYQAILPYFKKSENQQAFLDFYHGAGGPVDICNIAAPHLASKAFVKACTELGYPETGDFNGEEQEGGGLYQVYVKNGQRVSTATAYLDFATKRENLKFEVGAVVRRILFDKQCAIGVEYEEHGDVRQQFATREVILCAGAVDSPKLLLLSGVGPRAELRSFGIPVVADLPGVGQNLRDHTIAAIGYLYADGKPSPNPSAGAVEAGLFERLSPEKENTPPDLQYLFSHWMLVDPRYLKGHVPEDGFSIVATLLRPQSGGAITLRSADPSQPPEIRANYLESRRDLEFLLHGVKLSRQLAASRAMKAYRGEEIAPGDSAQSDEQLMDYIRDVAAGLFHCSCSCRMGWDRLAVVSPSLKVHGVDRLRIVDASVMPEITSGNTNAPTVMIAEKGSDLISQEAKGHK